ncbi:MAG: hypothetical protein U0271_12010 [Polyangiaceae bacterium]
MQKASVNRVGACVALAGILLSSACGGKADSKKEETKETKASAAESAKSTTSAKTSAAAAPEKSASAQPAGSSAAGSATPAPVAAPKETLSKNVASDLGDTLTKGEEIAATGAADSSSGLIGWGDASADAGEAPPAGDADNIEGLAKAQAFDGSSDSVKSASPDQANSNVGYVAFRRLETSASSNGVVIKTAGLAAAGQGNWATIVFVMQGDQRITQSEPKLFKVNGETGVTGGVEFSLNTASGGLEKIKGQVVFTLAALRQVGNEYQLVNFVPALIADIRYGTVEASSPTYAAVLNGRLFRANGVFTNTNQPAVSAIEFLYDSQRDCLFTRYVDFAVVQGRLDEGMGYEGCASPSAGEVGFTIEAVCKYAPNNEPQCKKHNDTASSKFVLYPYGIGLFGRIFREPGVG